jgi:hypothetical protein
MALVAVQAVVEDGLAGREVLVLQTKVLLEVLAAVKQLAFPLVAVVALVR